jgi:hypothetical protein
MLEIEAVVAGAVAEGARKIAVVLPTADNAAFAARHFAESLAGKLSLSADVKFKSFGYSFFGEGFDAIFVADDVNHEYNTARIADYVANNLRPRLLPGGRLEIV